MFKPSTHSSGKSYNPWPDKSAQAEQVIEDEWPVAEEVAYFALGYGFGNGVGWAARTGLVRRAVGGLTSRIFGGGGTRALSPYRQTVPGEKFLRYESGHAGYTRVTTGGGLKPGTFTAAGNEGMVRQGQLAIRYNLPSPGISRTVVHEITPPPGTWVVDPSPVIGGTGSEVLFPFGDPPGSVGPPLTVFP